jgi:FlaA1/EpsC-like NDP-sugar epimerase
VQRLFSATRPEVIFHAAAHKHVPIMERHPAEAVLNNVFGTRALGEAADGFGAESFVFISTDKAVRPASVMGATKRLAERWVRGMAARSRTRFVAVRFGNVLGSSGSVLPIFIAQIQRGGPVTVTHPEMRRFFMSIPEACGLVLEATSLGRGGELFVLDMGAPVKIVDLAERLIERAGLRPGDDVPIVFSGARPGEKLYEELAFAGERVTPTARAGILRVGDEEPGWQAQPGALEELERCAQDGDDRAVRALLAEILPEYRAVDLDAGEDEDATETEIEEEDEQGGAIDKSAAISAALS